MNATLERTVRTRKEPWISHAAWDEASARASSDSTHMTVTRTLEVLLASYGNGAITIKPGTPEAPGTTGRHVVNVDSAVWEKAEEQRKRDGIRSMAALCGILLHAYAKQNISLTVQAAGTIGESPTRTEHPGK
ncbi:hypothetical protein [Streptomyces sp. CS014]|uniref:hypothetical protein n=1 Tax=Streptomyces sp. CS014 TaxID=2162707 RepID=UPI0013A54021|nr:hypothetical protein [Streptomyces sp. CS014]